MGHYQPLFSLFRLFNTVDRKQMLDKSLRMTRFEPWTSDVGDSRSTTEPHHCPNCLVKRFRSSFEVLIRDDFLHADDKSGLFSFHPFFPPPMIDIEMFKTFFVGIEILVGQVKRRHVKNCQLTKCAYLPTM